MNKRIQHIVIGIGLISLMTFLFFKTTAIDSESHNRFSSDLRHLKELDATLDKNILESRFGLQNSYDILTTEAEQIRQLQENLKNIPAYLSQDERAEINSLLAKHTDLQNQKNLLIERFKSRNAVINNSLRYFPVTTSNLIRTLAEKNSNHDEMKSLNYLLRDTLIYYLLTDKQLEQDINDQIAKLQDFKNQEKSAEEKTDIGLSISHAQTILRLKPEVDGLVRETFALQTEKQIEELIKKYDSYYNESLSRANFYQLFLYIFSVLLIAYIAYIIVRLQKATKELNAVNENLELRVQERTEELLLTNAELQNSRDYFNQIINAVGDPVFVKNRRHQLTLANDAMVKFTGRSREELIGKTSHDLFAAEEAEVFWEKDELVFTSGKENVNEEKFTDLEGNVCIIITRKRLHIDKDGEQFIVGVSRDITESKKTEEALRVNEAKFRDLFDNAPVAYHELDTEGRFMRINHTEELMLGYTSDELKGRHPWEIIVEKVSREATKEKLTGLKKLEPIERTFIRKDGTLISVLNEDRMIYDSDGKITGIRSTLQDITNRKRLEAEAQVISEVIQGVSMTSNQEELLKHIHHSISKLIFAENCFVALYNESTEMLDLQLFVDKHDVEPPAFKLGKGMTAYVFRNKRPMLLTQKKIQQLIEDKEIEMVGTPPAVWLGVPLRSPNGIIGVLVIQHYEDENAYNQRDLEFLTAVGDQIALGIERKRSEEALKASEARFQSAFDNAPIGICLTSPNGSFQQVNHSFCGIVGYSKEELLATNFQSITHPNDLQASKALVSQLLSGEIKTGRLEKRYFHKLGHHVLAQTSLSLARDAQNKPLYIIAQTQDITEQKLLEDQLQRGQKLESIGQLAAGIAHEINTPTQYVGDNTRFLKDSFDDLAEVLKKNEQLLKICHEKGFKDEIVTEMEAAIKYADTEYLMEEIPKSIDQALVGIGRIATIVQSMKDFAHPGSVDKKAADLNRAIESTITVASNEWKYVAEMETDFDQSLPNVPCLIGEFNQVILNMIVNAAHAISDVIGDGSNGKGTIKIGTKRQDDWVEISVSDTGTGMPEEIRKKIFDPFFTTKEVGKGTGQGLAISHSVITEKHKGKINVESEIGKGTKFIISLPVNEDFIAQQ